jgi:hypothetical protein
VKILQDVEYGGDDVTISSFVPSFYSVGVIILFFVVDLYHVSRVEVVINSVVVLVGVA